MRARPVVIGRQRQRRHGRAEIGAADADVDDVGDLLAGGAGCLAGAHGVGEGAHGVEHGEDFRLHVLPVEHHALAAEVAQRRVQHGAAFGDVDLLAGEHSGAAALEIGGPCQFLQQVHRLRVNRAFRPVEQQVAVGGGECLEALGIGGESFAHAGGRGCAMIAQRGELFLKGRLIHCKLRDLRAIIKDRMFPARVVATMY